ncbi:glutamate 5-kinase [Metabacillus sp. KIGAM252]|uniref:Glutamate 5-kinase n=1 Tax=Metabacillus flavus TaxID=2823519 RepID=A0ABS5LF47_9BACI|nr:glutamate 5-kinase [Metabacillus flavus]MBS2969231.1 glutamate 5-kinase [Metabacillus flavus]
MTNKKRIVIKIGSSSLTSLHGEISRRKLKRIVEEVVELKEEGHEVLLVSSGAVAAGYRKLGCVDRPTALTEKQAAASIGQGLLMEAYSEYFLSHGYVASQILITRSDFSDEKRYMNARNTLKILLDRGIVPIVNENDTVTIDRLKFGDNDTLSAKVAGLVDADQLIIMSDIDGLYDSDPRKNPHAELLLNVHEITSEIEDSAGDPGSGVGTGGMKSKIEAFKITMASGIPAFLGKSGIKGLIGNAVSGTARGTYFNPSTERDGLDHRKQWIAFNSGPEGSVTVNDKAKTAIVEHSGELHAQHVIKVSGRFKHGAVVRLKDDRGEEIGLGIVNYSSEQLSNFRGLDVTGMDQDAKAIVDSEGLVCRLDFPMPAGV